ncbi:hypothetical protein Avbf_01088 [Armadillidium vulgare]|nr:hypothetical protein Avbf_01088 [Armadillidium vulgare]
MNCLLVLDGLDKILILMTNSDVSRMKRMFRKYFIIYFSFLFILLENYYYFEEGGRLLTIPNRKESPGEALDATAH